MNDTALTKRAPADQALRAMMRIPEGSFAMGSEDFYPEERPVRQVWVEAFWMDPHPVTVAEFRRFVKATGYVTVAERQPEPADYPNADPGSLVPGSLVFTMPRQKVGLDDWRRWWAYVPGADWRRPQGPDSSANGRELHPVTQVSYEDAAAYATWAGKQLPSEAEWEFAARGGLEATVFAWGDEFMPRGRPMANTWHGEFPWQYLPGSRAGERPDTTPVRTYAPNGYGLYDMTGNVWEWTSDHFTADHSGRGDVVAAAESCCAPRAGQAVGRPETEPGEQFPRRVTKGGSHLCAPNYCLRYRPAARQGQTEDTATCHLGFRCVVRERELA